MDKAIIFFYVPVIDQNLLGVGQLHEKGFIVIFENNHSVIKDASDKVIFSIKMRSKRFSFNLMKEATYQVTIDNTEIWIKRLGHLQRNELVHVLPDLDDESPIYKKQDYLSNKQP